MIHERLDLALSATDKRKERTMSDAIYERTMSDAIYELALDLLALVASIAAQADADAHENQDTLPVDI